ncbi:ABC transporter permease [Halorussus aquaticus]|uniref:ABC transporter permease n=1 Tax=Halorussus aquaticus TaxID=2953748 RepID=A0ABD5PZW0_9EURY|nr:ABC transporter permease subunit [Halorussus aquaticus]
MATNDASTGERLASAALTVVSPRTERGRERRRIVALCLPFLTLASVAGLYPLWEMLRISLSTSKYVTTFDPLGIVAASLTQGKLALSGVSTRTYELLLEGGTRGAFHEAAFNTLWFGAVTTAASLGVAVPVAHALEKYDLPGERHVLTLLSFPISLPGIVAAFMIIVLFGNSGLLTKLAAVASGRSVTSLALSTSVVGLFLAYLYSMIPRSLLLLRGAYSELNAEAEEAARSLGASPARTFWYVTLPQIKPGLVGAAILTFRTALAIFGTLVILSQALVEQPWTYQINDVLSPEFDIQLASAMAVVWFGFVLGFTVLGLRYTSAEVGI